MADDILRQGVQGISDLITRDGLVNLDFADVQTIMSNSGSALMGIGEATGEGAAVNAVKAAISSPLLETGIQGARGIILNIVGSNESLSMSEVYAASTTVQESASPDAEIIWGASLDDSLGETVRVTIVATRFEGDEAQGESVQAQPSTKDSFGLSAFQESNNSTQPQPPTPPRTGTSGGGGVGIELPTFMRRK